jgi:uncharacterized membrane protein (DUF373 family)
MKNVKSTWQTKVLNSFIRFEIIVTFILSLLVGLIVITTLIRIVLDFYYIFILDIINLKDIVFEDYQLLFGKILTLIISLEFLNSIIKVFKSKDVKTLVLDVVLIAALAIARKLIIYDYKNIDPAQAISLGGLLISIGIFYFLIKFSKSKV